MRMFYVRFSLGVRDRICQPRITQVIFAEGQSCRFITNHFQSIIAPSLAQIKPE